MPIFHEVRFPEQISWGAQGGPGFSRPVLTNAAAFAGAKRFHQGGVVGTGANEVPIIARRGEVVLTEDQAGFLKRALSGTAEVGNVGASTRQQPGGARDIRDNNAVNVTVAMTVIAQDAGSFRRAQGNVGAELAATINRQLRRDG